MHILTHQCQVKPCKTTCVDHLYGQKWLFCRFRPNMCIRNDGQWQKSQQEALCPAESTLPYLGAWGMVPDPMAQTVQWARRGQKGRAVRLVSVPGTCLTKSKET